MHACKLISGADRQSPPLISVLVVVVVLMLVVLVLVVVILKEIDRSIFFIEIWRRFQRTSL